MATVSGTFETTASPPTDYSVSVSGTFTTIDPPVFDTATASGTFTTINVFTATASGTFQTVSSTGGGWHYVADDDWRQIEVWHYSAPNTWQNLAGN